MSVGFRRKAAGMGGNLNWLAGGRGGTSDLFACVSGPVDNQTSTASSVLSCQMILVYGGVTRVAYILSCMQDSDIFHKVKGDQKWPHRVLEKNSRTSPSNLHRLAHRFEFQSSRPRRIPPPIWSIPSSRDPYSEDLRPAPAELGSAVAQDLRSTVPSGCPDGWQLQLSEPLVPLSVGSWSSEKEKPVTLGKSGVLSTPPHTGQCCGQAISLLLCEDRAHSAPHAHRGCEGRRRSRCQRLPGRAPRAQQRPAACSTEPCGQLLLRFRMSDYSVEGTPT